MKKLIAITLAALALTACGETDAEISARNAASRNAASASSAVLSAEAANTPPATPWSYRTDRDEMRNAETMFATIASVNDVPVTWPYTPSPATLMLRRKPAEGLEVIILIDGQFTCSLSGDRVAVKFDDGPIQRYGCDEAIGGTGALFIRTPQRFLTNLREAKKVIIEMPVYQAGTVQMTWEITTPPEFS